jgi:hypothetical protein
MEKKLLKKYRLKKLYPGSNKIDTISFSDKEENLYTMFPEYFEEVKEKLFTTEDGVDIYKGDVCYSVMVDIITWDEYDNLWIVKRSDFNCDKKQLTKDFFKFETQKYFSSIEVAEKYIDENKPMYSKKQIKEALEKSDNITVSRIEFLRIFKEKLKIN